MIVVGSRVRLVKLPRYFDGTIYEHLVGRLGCAIEVSQYGTVYVRWDDGSEGGWTPECLGLAEDQPSSPVDPAPAIRPSPPKRSDRGDYAVLSMGVDVLTAERDRAQRRVRELEARVAELEAMLEPAPPVAGRDHETRAGIGERRG